MDAGRLDSARVSAARSSPMGDTLELCARYADAATVEALVPRLVPLVRDCDVARLSTPPKLFAGATVAQPMNLVRRTAT